VMPGFNSPLQEHSAVRLGPQAGIMLMAWKTHTRASATDAGKRFWLSQSLSDAADE
jgi:hypothetical protein